MGEESEQLKREIDRTRRELGTDVDALTEKEGYRAAFADDPRVRPLAELPHRTHGRHLFVVRVDHRRDVFGRLRSQGIGVQVHYIPVHLHPYYRERFGKNVRYALEFVDLIPQEPSGKYRFCISHVPHPSAAEGGRIAA